MVPQLFWDRLNGPDTANERPLAAVPPEFETVTIWAALGLYRSCAGKESCVGLTLRPAADSPVPSRGTVTGATPAVDDEIVSVAEAPPDDAGVKIT